MLAMPVTAFPALFRGRLLVAAGMYPAPRQNYYAIAQELYGAGVETARAVGDLWTIAWGIQQIGWLCLMRGELDEARARVQESVLVFRELGDPWGAALARSALGLALELTGDPAGPAMLEEGLRLAQALGDPWSLAGCHAYIGDAARAAGDSKRGRAAFTESLRFFRLLGNVNASALTLYEIGSLALLDGDLRSAATCFTEALDLHLEHGGWHNVANLLAGLAKTAWRLGQPDAATRLFGATQARLDAIGLPLWAVDRDEANRLIADLRRTRGDAAFTAAWDEGYALSTDEAIAAARAIAAEAMNAGSAPAIAAEALRLGLTPREVEVLRLLARRLTDREIAETLFISPKTAGKHVGNILAKLQAADRRQAAALAAQLGLD
jgi:DNA-binding CsgD family transcriptional regulator